MKITIFLFALLWAGNAMAGSWYSNERTVDHGIRTGKTPSGAEYRILPDHSASIAKNGEIWLVKCKIDIMNDAKNCAIYDGLEHIVIDFKAMNRPVSICVIGHNFPGRHASIRVDKNKAVQTDEDGCIGGRYIVQMLKGQQFITRKVVWPYDNYDDDFVSSELTLLPESIELMKYIKNL
ncbi:hypothetical protein V6582_17515 [Agrobacterium vitis]|uniref:hypothetical protein n=1 Tax=Agrobacterium vitis TaxID=373 RepID=UPI0012E90BF7|nr:hypothetical protein [Agrobacterium vitis]MVA27625.1 hypothetical protein [Agrobacterium vitis]